MPRKPSQALDYAAYLAVRCIVCLFQILSNSTARWLAAGLAWIAWKIDRRHRLVALDNLGKAFPEHNNEADREALVFAMYVHFLTLIVEVSQLPRKMHRHNAHCYLDLGPDEDILLKLFQSERPVLIVSGHFGNWELAGYGLGARGIRTYAIARALDNPYLEAFLRRFREGTGQTILAKNDLSQIKAALERGGKVAVLADQNAGRRGLMVNFFGRGASTHKGIAVLALQYRAPLVVVGIRKVGEPMRYRMDVEDVIYPEEYVGFRAEAVRKITQRYTTALERVIRTAPEQYLWLHNRWKRSERARPETAKAA